MDITQLKIVRNILTNEKEDVVYNYNKATIKNPVAIALYKDPDKNKIIRYKLYNDNHTLKNGDEVTFFGKRVGFIIFKQIIIEDEDYIFDRDDISPSIYATQFRISKVCMEDDIIKIYEEGKDIPWEFDLNGNLLNENLLEDNYNYDQHFRRGLHKNFYDQFSYKLKNDCSEVISYSI